MVDVVCHIGLHKTASGTLQRQFFPACSGLNLLTTLDPAVREFVAWLRDETRRDAGASGTRKGSDRRRSVRSAAPPRPRAR